MAVRFFGLLLTFSAVIGVIALGPAGGDRAVAILQTETPTNTAVATNTTVATSTNTTVPTTTSTATATATTTPVPGPGGISLAFPASQCQGTFQSPTSANVTFSWSGPANVSAIYVDLSMFDNNFQDATYVSVILPPGTTTFTWNGIQAGQSHFWRVTGAGLNGEWVTSNFARFVPCGTSRILTLTYGCAGGGRADVTFRWAPSSSPGFFQFLDLSIFNNNFAPGSFLGAGPLAGDQQALIWPGILANIIHYFRINTNSFLGWGASGTGSFVAQC